MYSAVNGNAVDLAMTMIEDALFLRTRNCAFGGHAMAATDYNGLRAYPPRFSLSI